MVDYVTLTEKNIANEHLCCAISGKKHQAGVDTKRAWLSERLSEGHVFRKLDANGKVFIEYAPLETAWVPVVGENYLYIYCLWVSGSFKGQGHGKNLLQSCIDDAKCQNKSGVCVISSQKKTPFLTDKKFVERHGFKVVDQIEGGYELLALSLDGTVPAFSETARQQTIDDQALTIFYGQQCPFIPNGLKEVQEYCEEEKVPLTLIPVDSLEKAKNLPGIFNNWAVYYQGKFLTIHMYINSGNVLFSSESEDREKLIRQCEAVITDQFDLTIPVTVVAVEELADTIMNAPDWWNQEKETVHYAIFLIPPMTVSEVFKVVGEIKPDYEKIAHHGEVIFWTAPRQTFNKARWSKIASSSVNKQVTIRNANTINKLLLMNQ